jgi:hypothetical protein
MMEEEKATEEILRSSMLPEVCQAKVQVKSQASRLHSLMYYFANTLLDICSFEGVAIGPEQWLVH